MVRPAGEERLIGNQLTDWVHRYGGARRKITPLDQRGLALQTDDHSRLAGDGFPDVDLASELEAEDAHLFQYAANPMRSQRISALWYLDAH